MMWSRIDGASWSAADAVSRLLTSDDRDAVRGDLIESNATGIAAVREITGLVVRRQAAPWMDWRPWLALAGVIPLGALIALIARGWADGSAIYVFLYANKWTLAFLQIPGARRDFICFLARFCLNSVTLVVWAWTIGVVLGSLSRRTRWTHGLWFYLALFAGMIAGAPPEAHGPSDLRGFSPMFFHVEWPLLVLAGFVYLPAIWECLSVPGVARSHRRTPWCGASWSSS